MKTYLDAKSIHIFGWPFFVADFEPGGESLKQKMLQKGWKQKKMDFAEMEGDSMEQIKQTYMLEQYLSSAAKDLFIKEEHRDCIVFEYKMQNTEKNGYIYRIVTDKKTYELPIDYVELHMYKYGVGILFLRTLNMDEDTSIEDIKIINEKGRSISIPFIPETADGYILCPERLAIVKKENGELIEKENLKADFRKRIKNFYEVNNAETRTELGKRAQFLDSLLNLNFDGRGNNDVMVTSFNDYRMFVMALIRDAALSANIKDAKWRQSKKGEKELYSILYVDESDATCQDKMMRSALLSESTYSRWADWGTLYNATEYAFICITSESQSIDASVVRPFYAEYSFIVSLVLAQRMALMMYFDKAEQLATRMFQKKKKHRLISKKECRQLIDLQEMYIEYQNSMMILEISSQEQGIELYHLLQKQLLIERERAILDNQIKSLYEVVNVSNGSRSALWGNIWAILAIVIAIPTLILEGPRIWEMLREFIMDLIQ